ncbi:MAG: GDSL-type esterase/lipase family protein [Nitrospirota bacterium]
MREKKRVVFIGDSLTEYYDWQQRFPSYEVDNLGIAGETVEGLLGRVDKIITIIGRHNPEALFIMTGINNIAMEDYAITGICREVVKRLAAAFPEAKIVVQSILPVELPWVESGKIQEINKALKEVAREVGGAYLDVYASFVDKQGKPDRSCLLDDGVHLSGRGYEVWSAIVESFLEKAGV